jgi:hypothetical protein
MNIKFEWLASTDPLDQSGVATWRYKTTNRDAEEVEIVLRHNFPKFEAAHCIFDLLKIAYDQGVSEGDRRVCNAVLGSLRDYR